MTLIATVSRHTLRQLKFIIPGGFVTFWLNTHHAFWKIFVGDTDNGSWARTSALITVLLGVLTVSLFLYVLLVPLIHGIRPDFRSWRHSGVLSTVIPVLTGSIVFGWTLTAFTLGRWSELGYLRGIIGASGLYALAFGLMGLIPAPKLYHRS